MLHKTSWIIGLNWAMLFVLAACQPTAAPAVPATPTILRPVVGTAMPGQIEALPTATHAPSPTPALGPQAAGASGLRITAQIGPTCAGPVRPGQVCTKPYQGEFIITGQADAEVARVSTDENGAATVNVPPGAYTITPHLDPQQRFPIGAPLVVTVPPNQIVEAAFDLDTGIR